MTQQHIEELSAKIFQICAQCPHSKFVTGRFECNRKRSQCHSKRVRAWLDEIERLVRRQDESYR